MFRYAAVALIVIAGLSGCTGPNESMTVRHEESSERTRITVERVPDSFSYADLFIVMDGKSFAFGQFADFSDRRYMVEGKKDSNALVEADDVILVPGAGQTEVRLLRGEKELASFEAFIPDNKAPLAPVVRDPANQAQGVSRTPSFRWTAVADPSGTQYTLVYSLDPNFAVPVLRQTVEQLDETQYSVGAGNELLAGQKYYWHVRAIDGAGNASPWSQTQEFLVSG